MAENTENPKPDVADIRARVNQIIAERAFKKALVAREAGISGAALSRFLVDRYDGDNAAVASKLLAWIEALERRDNVPAVLTVGHEFVDTTSSGRIMTGMRFAQATRSLVMIHGEPGVGKTITLKEYKQKGASVWLVTMSPDTSSKVPMLQEIGINLGLPVKGGAADMRRAIVARIVKTGGVLLVDEAQHLDKGAIEQLRRIHDEAEIGLVVCGNTDLKAKVETSHNFNSRIGMKVRLTRPSQSDVSKLSAQYDLADAESLDFLSGIAQLPGGLRCVVKTIQLALMSAAGDGNSLCLQHLASAWSGLALEE
ncbi:MAG: AAA family ATPase [Gluconacetobacter sp.]